MSISDINFNLGRDASQGRDSRLDQTFGEQTILSDGRSAKDMREYLAKDLAKKGSVEYNATIDGDSIVFGANDLSQRGTTGDAASATLLEKDKTIAAQQETIDKQSKEIKEMSDQIALLIVYLPQFGRLFASKMAGVLHLIWPANCLNLAA